MRTLFYWFLVLFFFVSGAWLMINKDSHNPYEIPYLSESSMGLSFTSFGLGESNIFTVDKWKETLTGKWDFDFRIDEGKYVSMIKGQVTYSPDGTFSRRLSYAEYSKKRKRSETMAGGTIRGEWNVGLDSTWVEIVNKDGYSLRASGEDKLALIRPKMYFPTKKYFGIMEHDTKDFELISFNNNRIEIRAKDLSDGFTDSYILTRIE